MESNTFEVAEGIGLRSAGGGPSDALAALHGWCDRYGISRFMVANPRIHGSS